MSTSKHLVSALVAINLLASYHLSAPNHPPAQKTLDIEPVYQQTPVWCWAAVGEMVFRHYEVRNINPAGNFQCGIVALLHTACNQNCGNCPVPAGSLATMINMLTRYPTVASQVSRTQTRITTQVSRRPLPMAEVMREIDEGRPVVAGISPSGYRTPGISQHVALIVGYDRNALVVNDPFPFRAAFAGNPYEAAGGEELEEGQYRISYVAFANRLQWAESIYRITCTGEDCAGADSDADDDSDDDDSDADTDGGPIRRPPPPPAPRYGRSCQTPIGTCGPFFNQPALPVGSPCHCATVNGPMNGRVVP